MKKLLMLALVMMVSNLAFSQTDLYALERVTDSVWVMKIDPNTGDTSRILGIEFNTYSNKEVAYSKSTNDYIFKVFETDTVTNITQPSVVTVNLDSNIYKVDSINGFDATLFQYDDSTNRIYCILRFDSLPGDYFFGYVDTLTQYTVVSELSILTYGYSIYDNINRRYVLSTYDSLGLQNFTVINVDNGEIIKTIKHGDSFGYNLSNTSFNPIDTTFYSFAGSPNSYAFFYKFNISDSVVHQVKKLDSTLYVVENPIKFGDDNIYRFLSYGLDSNSNLSVCYMNSINLDSTGAKTSRSSNGKIEIPLANYGGIVTKIPKSNTGIKTKPYPPLVVYPNPTHGEVNLNESGEIRVYNTNGSLLTKVQNSSNTNISGFTNGTYIIQFIKGGNRTTAKIILNK